MNTINGVAVYRLLGLVVASAFAFWAPVVSLAAFAPNEIVVSPQPDLVDLEFNASKSQFVWTDVNGSLWIGNISPTTGMFSPANGKAILVDAAAMKTFELYIIYNGPEWITTADGDQIVYTKFLPKRQHTLANARIAVAQQNPDGTWAPRFLGPSVPRNAPYASDDANDPAARITYVDNLGNHYWRELDNADTEELLPLPPSIKSVRFVKGRRAVVFSTPIGGVSQVFYYDLDTKVLEQMTFDAGDKDLQTVPWMWSAPELNNDYVFMTVVQNTELRIYRYSDGSSGAPIGWSPIRSVSAPPGSRFASPEPFVHNGKSFISMAMATEPNSFPSAIWLANIDAARPVFRKISDDSLLRARTDPEVFITTNGPYIYYNRYNQNVNPGNPYCASCSEGVFRAFTGLLPPQ